jgi:hypothetical protein
MFDDDENILTIYDVINHFPSDTVVTVPDAADDNGVCC